MRLISQDGKWDIDYDQCNISKDYGYQNFYINALTSGGARIEIAKYSTREKVEKAMEMLRTAHTGTPLLLNNCNVADEVAEILKRKNIEAILTVTDDKPKVDYLDNFYFRFPADEDVEV